MGDLIALQINNQRPGSHPTLSYTTQASPSSTSPASPTTINTIPPEQRMLIYAFNRVKDQVKKKRYDWMHKMEVTGMRNFQAVTKFRVKATGFDNKVRNELKANECPQSLIDAIVQDIALIDEDQKIKLDNKVVDGQGNLFKLMYFMKREGESVWVSMAVFGASFDQKTVTHYDKKVTPKYEQREVTTRNWWTRESITKVEMVKIGEETIETPAFKTMTGADVLQCMEFLEDKACEKVTETAAPCELQAAEAGGRASHIWSDARIWILTLLGIGLPVVAPMMPSAFKSLMGFIWKPKQPKSWFAKLSGMFSLPAFARSSDTVPMGMGP